MKKIIFKTSIILLAIINFSFCISFGTNGVYLTKEDFITNRISYSIHKPFLNSNTNYECRIEGTLCITLDDGEKIKFKPHQIFGFSNNGRKYIFDDYWWGPSYLAVLNESPVGIFISQVYSRHHEAFFRYSKKIGDTIKDLSEENILSDFKNDNNVKQRMLYLFHALPGTFKPSEDDFRKYQHIVSDCFQSSALILNEDKKNTMNK